MTATNAEIARRGFEAAASGEFDAIATLLDPAVRWHGGDPDADGACHNREQALAVIRQGYRGGAIGELVEVVEVGSRVVVVMRSDDPESGEPELHANLSTFRDGKVVEMVAYEDARAALHAAGTDSGPPGTNLRS